MPEKPYVVDGVALRIEREKTPNSFVIAAFAPDREEDVGLCEARRQADKPETAYLRTVEVDKNFQSRGLGRYLVSQMTEWLREEAFTAVETEVLPENIRFQRLLAKQGWAKSRGRVVDEFRLHLQAKPRKKAAKAKT